jgi:hypothetical protein
MAQVDPYDDTRDRWVVFHYRFDPERHERRNVIVAAFDRKREFKSFMKKEGEALRAAREAGDAQAGENLSGVRWPAGYHARIAEQRQQNRRHAAGSRYVQAFDPTIPTQAATYGPTTRPSIRRFWRGLS